MEPETTVNEKHYPITCSFTDFEDNEILLTYGFKKPSEPQLNRCTSEAGRKKKNPMPVFKNFLLSIIDPADADEFNKNSDEYPGIVLSLSDNIFDRMGYASAGK